MIPAQPWRTFYPFPVKPEMGKYYLANRANFKEKRPAPRQAFF
jgi:hypothetical protein